MGLTKRIAADAGWAVMRISESLVRGRGPAYAVGLGRALGGLAWPLVGSRRRLSLRNGDVVLPHLPPTERRRVVREAILNSFPYWLETVTYAYRGPHHINRAVTVEGLQHLDRALARGRGVLAPSVHLGIFPLVAVWMTQAGYDFQFLSRFPHDDRATKTMARVRARTGIRLIRDHPRRECLVKSRDALARGGIICFQLDQRTLGDHPGVDVPFFGRPFRAFGGMVSLAIKMDVPLVPMYIHRERGIHHRIVIEPEVDVDRSGDRRAVAKAIIEHLMGSFEGWVREYPEHWWWPRKMWDGV